MIYSHCIAIYEYILKFVGVEAVVTAVVDRWPGYLRVGRRREVFIGIVCIISFFIGLSMVTNVSIFIPLIRNVSKLIHMS